MPGLFAQDSATSNARRIPADPPRRSGVNRIRSYLMPQGRRTIDGGGFGADIVCGAMLHEEARHKARALRSDGGCAALRGLPKLWRRKLIRCLAIAFFLGALLGRRRLGKLLRRRRGSLAP
jgi:hypothetical protein